MTRRSRILAAACALAVAAACTEPRGDLPALAPARDLDGARWATWVLSSPSAVRPVAPPAAGSPEARREIDELLERQRGRTIADERAAQGWDGAPTLAWSQLAVDRFGFWWPLLPDVRDATPARSARAMALLHVAMYDALVAAWDAKVAYGRTPPAATDARIHPAGEATALPSYPSEHAAAAGAAAVVLSYVLAHERAAEFDSLARAAAESRITAGLAFRSDVEAGLALGRAVGATVVARARADGADAEWSGSVPIGDGLWQPTPPRRVAVPFDATAGSWRSWVIPSGSAFRPPPPPAPGSLRFEADLEELRTIARTRTEAQATVARYWATEAPSARWELFMLAELRARRLSPLRAARAQALASVAAHDAMIACWEGKFHYWLARPITVEPRLVTAFSTPPFPSYPSGHSTMSAALAEVFAELFPDSAAAYHARAHEASISRVYAGVHYRFDIEAGETLGAQVGRAVVARARSDGAAH